MTHLTFRGTRAPVAAALLALAAACGGGDRPREYEAGPLPPGTRQIAASARFQPPVRSGNCYSGPIRFVFHSQEEWDNYWVDERRGCTSPPIPAGVDWRRDMLVYAAMGKRMSPKDRISIDGAGVRNDTVIIAIRRWMLMDGCPGPQAPTFPQSLVRIPANNGPVRFAEEHRKIVCDDEKS
ncbi:MAG TPA: hypothetical protein VF771_06815 [Longimicrobiaceae bacterium]